MSETNVVVPTQEVPKKRRGMPKGGWPKKDNPTVEVTRNKLPMAMDGEALRKFAYKGTPGEMEEWEGDETRSAMHTPKEIRDAYPELTFRYVSDYSIRTRGKNYRGWQKFSDNNYPEGVKRGNDMFLAAMPKERAQRYRDKVAEDSVQRIRSQQEKSIQFLASEGAMSQEEVDAVARANNRSDLVGSRGGLIVGVRPTTKTRFGKRTVTGGVGQSGMSRAEAHDHIRREIAERKKNRVYSFGKR